MMKNIAIGKKGAVIAAAILCLFTGVAVSAQSSPAGRVEIHYTLSRIPGRASNQIVVWVEDRYGEYVDTLFATRYMVKKGWEERTECCPEWKDSLLWAGLSRGEIDALSSATQPEGVHTLVWECRDRYGDPVPDGRYFIKIEGNIRWEKRVLWEAVVDLGEVPVTVEADAHYIPDTAAELETLLSDVSVSYIPDN